MVKRWRERIQNSGILNMLLEAGEGKRKMTSTQARINLALIGKVLPDLQAITHTGEIEHNIVMGSPISPDAWANKHVIEGQADQVSRPGSETPVDASGQAQEPRSLPAPIPAGVEPRSCLTDGLVKPDTDPIALAAAMAQEQGPPWRIGPATREPITIEDVESMPD